MTTLRSLAGRCALAAALTLGAVSLPGAAGAMTGAPAPAVTGAAPVIEAGHRGYRHGYRPYRRAYRAGRRHGYRKGYRRGYRHGRPYYVRGYYHGGPDVIIRGGVFFPPVFGGTVIIR